MSSLELHPWVKRFVDPLAPMATGEDPRYSDEFYKIKQEIDKVSGCDYELIEKNCEIILLKQAKDLRVVAYLLFAKLQRQGISGLCLSLNLYAELVKTFGDALFPQKPEVKISSINWLNEPRLKHLIKNKLSSADKHSVNELITQLKKVNTQLQEHLPVPDMPGVLTSTLAMLEAEQAVNEISITPINSETSIVSSIVENTTAAAAPQCQSESDFKTLVQLQLDYLYQKNEWFQAVALARAVRWSGLEAPLQQNNLTNVSIPHESLRSQLAYLVDKGAPKDILLCCENILMAPGGIFYLDAQYYAHRSASDMGQTSLANYIMSELRILLERAPELMNLQFVDGTPFISPQQRNWLENVVINKPSNSGKTTSKEIVDLNEVINQLRAKIAGKTLIEKINTINGLAKADRRIRFQHDYALARFCSEENRVDLALPLLEQLAKLIEQHQLAEWEPEFALGVWSELRSAWKQRQNFLPKDMQKQVEQRIEDLFSLICQTNVERAVNIR